MWLFLLINHQMIISVSNIVTLVKLLEIYKGFLSSFYTFFLQSFASTHCSVCERSKGLFRSKIINFLDKYQ